MEELKKQLYDEIRKSEGLKILWTYNKDQLFDMLEGIVKYDKKPLTLKNLMLAAPVIAMELRMMH